MRTSAIRTGDTNPINIVWDHTLLIHDIVELGSTTVEDDGVEPNAVQEAQAQRQLIELREDSTPNLDYSELGRLRRVRRGRENAEMPLDFAFGSDRIQ